MGGGDILDVRCTACTMVVSEHLSGIRMKESQMVKQGVMVVVVEKVETVVKMVKVVKVVELVMKMLKEVKVVVKVVELVMNVEKVVKVEVVELVIKVVKVFWFCFFGSGDMETLQTIFSNEVLGSSKVFPGNLSII